MRHLSVLAACVLILCGCAANLRLERMQRELTEGMRGNDHGAVAELQERYTQVAASSYGEGTLEWVKAQGELALLYAQWGADDLAVKRSLASVASAESRRSDDQALAHALFNLIQVHLSARRWSDAELVADRLRAYCDSVDAPGDGFTECDIARYSIDDAYLEAGAVEKFSDAYIRTDEKVGVTQDRESAILKLSVLGRGYSRFGAYPEAMWYFERCWKEGGLDAKTDATLVRPEWSSASGDVQILTMDSAHSFESQSPRCLEDLIELRRILGDNAEAERLAAIERSMWSRGPDLEKDLRELVRSTHSIWKDGYLTSHYANNLAFYLAGKGRYGEAIDTYRQAIAYIDEGLATDGVFHGVYPVASLIDELVGLGKACEAAGRFAEAAEAYERAAHVAADKLHPQDGRRLGTRAGFARALARAGRVDDSIDAWRVYLVEAETIRGPDHADYAAGLMGIGESLGMSGRIQEARQSKKRATAIRTAYLRRIATTRDLPLPVALRSAASPAN